MPTEEQTYREGVLEKLTRIEDKVTYTNGKVRKLIIALVLLSGVVLGQSFSNHDLIGIVAGLFSL